MPDPEGGGRHGTATLLGTDLESGLPAASDSSTGLHPHPGPAAVKGTVGPAARLFGFPGGRQGTLGPEGSHPRERALWGMLCSSLASTCQGGCGKA